MNRTEFIKNVSDELRANDIRKPISIPKQVFHISDDEGNSKDFTIKKIDKTAIYTKDDVDNIINACITVIEEALKQGDEVYIRGFGSLGLHYRKPRKTKMVNTDEEIVIPGRYIPKFSFGSDLRVCAKIYELTLNDKSSNNESYPTNIDADDIEDDEDDWGDE